MFFRYNLFLFAIRLFPHLLPSSLEQTYLNTAESVNSSGSNSLEKIYNLKMEIAKARAKENQGKREREMVENTVNYNSVIQVTEWS